MIEPGYNSTTPMASKPSAKSGSKNNYSMNARKISNGWLVKECWDEGEGENRQYKEVETYTSENPIEKEEED